MHSIRPRGFLHNNVAEIGDILSHDISALSLEQKQLWAVTWDCVVSISSDGHTDRDTASHKVFMPCIFLHKSQLRLSS